MVDYKQLVREYLDWQIRRGGCCSAIHKMKPRGTATYKTVIPPTPHRHGCKQREGRDGFSCGCNWDLGEADVEMALGGVFLARKKAFSVDIHTGKTCWRWWTAKNYENCRGIPCWFGRCRVWFCILTSYSPCQQLPAKVRKFIFIVMSVAELGTEIADTEEHLCWPGKVTKTMQYKVYFCILHLLCNHSEKAKRKGLGLFFYLFCYLFSWCDSLLPLN